MKFYLFVFPIVFFCSCLENGGNKNQASDDYVNKEINERIKMIGQINKDNDTIVINPLEVDKRVNELVLLSKDVENLGASVTLSNQYYSEMAAKYKVNAKEFKKVSTTMHANDIASLIKQNEMVLLNQVILNSGFKDILLHTAH